MLILSIKWSKNMKKQASHGEFDDYMNEFGDYMDELGNIDFSEAEKKEPVVYNPRNELGIGLLDKIAKKTNDVVNGGKIILNDQCYQFIDGTLLIDGDPAYKDLPGDRISVSTYNDTLIVITDAEDKRITSFKVDMAPLPEAEKGYHPSYKSKSDDRKRLASEREDSSPELTSAEAEKNKTTSKKQKR